jgi:predicted transcriptional regulator
MVRPKATFTLDAETIAALKRAAARTGKPQSFVVREAIAQYEIRAEQLTTAEQRHMLGVVAELRRRGPTATAAAVRREIASVRQARRRSSRG